MVCNVDDTQFCMHLCSEAVILIAWRRMHDNKWNVAGSKLGPEMIKDLILTYTVRSCLVLLLMHLKLKPEFEQMNNRTAQERQLVMLCSLLLNPHSPSPISEAGTPIEDSDEWQCGHAPEYEIPGHDCASCTISILSPDALVVSCRSTPTMSQEPLSMLVENQTHEMVSSFMLVSYTQLHLIAD